MQVQVTSDNLELTPSMQELANSKITKLSSRFEDTPEDLVSIRVVLNKSGADGMFKTKIDMDVGKLDVFSESADYSLETSLIEAVNELIRQYDKVIEKRNEKDWQEQREAKRFPIDSE